VELLAAEAALQLASIPDRLGKQAPAEDAYRDALTLYCSATCCTAPSHLQSHLVSSPASWQWPVNLKPAVAQQVAAALAGLARTLLGTLRLVEGAGQVASTVQGASSNGAPMLGPHSMLGRLPGATSPSHYSPEGLNHHHGGEIKAGPDGVSLLAVTAVCPGTTAGAAARRKAAEVETLLRTAIVLETGALGKAVHR
jgi:hypothetical protein